MRDLWTMRFLWLTGREAEWMDDDDGLVACLWNAAIAWGWDTARGDEGQNDGAARSALSCTPDFCYGGPTLPVGSKELPHDAPLSASTPLCVLQRGWSCTLVITGTSLDSSTSWSK